MLAGMHGVEVDMTQLPETAWAALDGMAMSALRNAGKWIVRGKRSRYSEIGKLPLHRAHTVWQLDQFTAEKCLVGQLDAVPFVLARWAPGIDGHLVQLHLTRYIAHLLVTGVRYELSGMREALGAKI